MIHYSCDRCKRIIESEAELRYVVRMEIEPALDGAAEEGQDDRDHLLDVHELLETMDESDCKEVYSEAFQKLRFDLCPECCLEFARSPIGRDRPIELNFSQN